MWRVCRVQGAYSYVVVGNVELLNHFGDFLFRYFSKKERRGIKEKKFGIGIV